MSAVTLEDRVAALEEEVACLKRRQRAALAPKDSVPWWGRIFGSFADNSDYEEAMRLGREYRESLRPKDAEDRPS